MLTLWVGSEPVRIAPGRLVPVIAAEIERASHAATQKVSIKDRTARIALKTFLAVYLDMIASDLDALHSTWPRPVLPKGADYIPWAIKYIASYWAGIADGSHIRLTVEASGGELTVTDIQVARLAAGATVDATAGAAAIAAHERD